MTEEEATFEARRRWGPTAGTFTPRYSSDRLLPCVVHDSDGQFKGHGKTWEEAFADADERDERDRRSDLK